MKFLRITISFLFLIQCAVAQQTVQQLRETALVFQRQQDYSNTIMVLAKALEMEPGNLDVLKDVAFTYYLSGDYAKAAQRILPLTDLETADEQIFQIGGTVFKELEDFKTAERLYKKGLKKFETSGALYSEYGDLFWIQQKPVEAITQWETGIKIDPSFSGNYYHASKFYFAAGDKSRSIVYGEIFVNLESYSVRSAEIKILLLESYKRIYMPGDAKKYYVKAPSPFEMDFLQVMSKQNELSLRGITPETLLIIRSRFILDWFNTNENKYAFHLFDHMRYLMREGMFEAYNQWLFGPASDPNAYQNWIRTHEDEYLAFSSYQRNKMFKMPNGQHYF
ncbi:MAG: tetratricopeptide repeat protein [Chitinophagaceae bacterium]|jgi:tetratricopeptide (TPR) repeat protein